MDKSIHIKTTFFKRLEKKSLPDRKFQEGVITSLLKKRLERKP
jgi:hypothetical protein